MGNALIKSEIKLTVGILVSNRIDHIRDCMEGLKPLLTAVSSELIAVDTKGADSDGSIDIVREYTDKIYPFTWCNDFAAARNVCLDHARGEWFLYLDDDEVFDDVSELIAFFNGEESERYQCGYYQVKSYGKNGSSTTAIVGRIIRRRENTRFVGRIHEGFNEIYEPGKEFKTFAHHYGYVYETEECELKHFYRNVSALEQELSEHGLSPRYCAQMVQEYLSVKSKRDEGYQLCLEYTKKLGEQKKLADSCSQWMLAAKVRYFYMEERFKECIEKAYELEKEGSLNETAWMAVAGTASRSAAKINDIAAILHFAPIYLKKYEWREKHPREALPQLQFDFVRYVQPEYKEAMADALAQAERVSKLKLQPVKSEIKLTIGMLVSNHVNYIRNCMESIRPLLEAIPSELVVIDTKGDETDGSIEIVREYTDKIYPFTWCNDFSAARNEILAHARGEWFLYFDDDEWFDDVTEFIEFFKSGECEKYYSGFYYTQDYQPDGSSSRAIAGRMIRRMENTRFVGKVHEQFEQVFAPNKLFSCFTHHYGYAYANEEQREAHQQRNLLILNEELKQNGITPVLCAQKVQELLSVPKTAEQGYQYCLESIDVLVAKGELSDSATQWTIVASIRYFWNKKQWKEALTRAETVKKQYPLSQTAQVALAAIGVECALACDDYFAMEQYALMYREADQWLSSHKNEALLQQQLDFPRFREESYRLHALYAGAFSSNVMQEFEQAYSFWKEFPWERLEQSYFYKNDLLKTLEGLKDKEPLKEYYRHFYREEYFEQGMTGYLPKNLSF